MEARGRRRRIRDCALQALDLDKCDAEWKPSVFAGGIIERTLSGSNVLAETTPQLCGSRLCNTILHRNQIHIRSCLHVQQYSPRQLLLLGSSGLEV